MPAVSLRNSAAMLVSYLVDPTQPFVTPNAENSLVAAGRSTRLGARATDQVERLHRSIFGSRGGQVEAKRVATTLIWARRRQSVTRLLSAIVPGVSRFLYLR